MNSSITIKRIYEQPEESDNYRMLIDRLWPRGVTKKQAKLNEWNKNIAPSNELRIWFDHKPENFDLFSKNYKKELLGKTSELLRIKEISENQHLTLLYAAKSPQFNHANVLLEVLKSLGE